MTIDTILSAELHRLGQPGRDFDLIDVRTEGEFAQVHVVGAANLPLSKLSSEAVRAARQAPSATPAYIICHSGGRSLAACRQLQAEGTGDVVNVAGGMSAWEQAGLPVVRGRGGSKSKRLRAVGLLLAMTLLILGFSVHGLFAVAGAGLWLAMVASGGCPLGACGVPVDAKD